MGFYSGTKLLFHRVFASADNDEPDQNGAESYSFDYWAPSLLALLLKFMGTTLIILLVDRIGRTLLCKPYSYFGGGCSLLTFSLFAAGQEDAPRF
jgi:hypothetical protein